MDPLDRAQVLLICDLCKRAALQSHCELCQINLCKACVGEHLSDSSKRHNVVPYKHRTSNPNVNYPICSKHIQKHCELYCEKCEICVCSTCLSSDEHKGHNLTNVYQNPTFIKEILNKDLKELEKRILPTYEEIASDLNTEKVNLVEKHYEKLITEVNNKGADWHREIDNIVNQKKSEIDEMKSKHLAVLNKEENEIKQITLDLKQSIHDMKKILDSDNISLTSAYKSRNAEFRSLPPKVNVSLPSFCPHPVNTYQFHQMFGSLSALSITIDEDSYTMKTPEAVSCPPVKPLLDVPKLIITVETGCQYLLRRVACLSDEKIWTCGNEKNLKLYNLQSTLLKSIQTKSGNIPGDITVTKSGDLVYTDPDTRTVNIVKNDQIQEVIRLQGWKPHYVCSTSSGDLLVTMVSDDDKQAKVVRYIDFKQKQTIQYDSEGYPLYSSFYINTNKYITENRNLDICVADCEAHAVVVVNQAGNLRFRYTGRPSNTRGTFNPYSITTDSQSQILTADFSNHSIHILDQDGHFLSYIDNCDIELPYGLCIDTSDNLFVAEYDSGYVKKIKYMSTMF
ncbi:tripartite motif containing 13-like [Saccostrea cucullata]|uniref:tripartite motif containing 13-like n=1 Tax=Saccostrea cuccullata TaxID=36930 RepID=UPI002ED199E1